MALPFFSISLPPLPVPAAGALASNIVFQTIAATRAEAGASHGSQRPSAPSPAQPAAWRADWRLWLMLLWAVGVAAAFTHMLVTCAAIWRLRRMAKASPDGHLSRELARELGISQAVEVLETSAGTMSMTFGIVRPAVFLPCDAAGWRLA